jgi:hypothetical protein
MVVSCRLTSFTDRESSGLELVLYSLGLRREPKINRATDVDGR